MEDACGRMRLEETEFQCIEEEGPWLGHWGQRSSQLPPSGAAPM